MSSQAVVRVEVTKKLDFESNCAYEEKTSGFEARIELLKRAVTVGQVSAGLSVRAVRKIVGATGYEEIYHWTQYWDR